MLEYSLVVSLAKAWDICSYVGSNADCLSQGFRGRIEAGRKAVGCTGPVTDTAHIKRKLINS